nr:hypothetical protein Josef01_05d18_16 [uncultured archaeon]
MMSAGSSFTSSASAGNCTFSYIELPFRIGDGLRRNDKTAEIAPVALYAFPDMLGEDFV